MEGNSFELERDVRWLNAQHQMRIRPLTGHVLVEVLPPDDKTTGGLWLPDIAHDPARGEKARAFKAVVVEMGPWKKTTNGYGILPRFGVGTRVLCSPYSGQPLSHNISDRLQLVRSDDVIAVLETT